jgi:hypothetical protein
VGAREGPVAKQREGEGDQAPPIIDRSLHGGTPELVGFNQGTNCFKDTVQILEDLAVPESHHDVARSLKLSSADLIFHCALGMLAAIEFDNQPRISADEISDIV